MSEERSPAPEKQTPNRKPSRSTLVAYLLVLFTVAFLLLLMSYFMQQRANDQTVIEGLQQNASALQITRSIQEQNETLRQQVADLEQENQTLAAQSKEQDNVALALDWLWRIEREYFQQHRATARQMMRDFEAAGLKEYLPSESLSDPEYRSPLEQYEAMHAALF